MCDCVRVRDFESALLQIVAEIQQRSADEERALRINHDAYARRVHHDVAIRGSDDGGLRWGFGHGQTLVRGVISRKWGRGLWHRTIQKRYRRQALTQAVPL